MERQVLLQQAEGLRRRIRALHQGEILRRDRAPLRQRLEAKHLVPVLRPVQDDLNLLRQVEPFPTQEVVPYDTAFLSGHVVEQYQVALTEATGDSEMQMRAALEQLAAQQIPGDTYRNLVIHPTFSSRTFKHVLVPIWLLVYMFGSRNFQVVVNGYTGRIAGRYPYSPWKIALLIVLAIIVFVLFVIANESS